jgi:hypothetical protein
MAYSGRAPANKKLVKNAQSVSSGPLAEKCSHWVAALRLMKL